MEQEDCVVSGSNYPHELSRNCMLSSVMIDICILKARSAVVLWSVILHTPLEIETQNLHRKKGNDSVVRDRMGVRIAGAIEACSEAGKARVQGW